MSTPNENVKSELAAALDHAEATVPALHRLRSQYECWIVGPMYAYGRNWHEANQSYELQWKPPRHRAVAAYGARSRRRFAGGATSRTIADLPQSVRGSARNLRKQNAVPCPRCRMERRRQGRELARYPRRPRRDGRGVRDPKASRGEAKYWRQIQANKRAAERDAKPEPPSAP